MEGRETTDDASFPSIAAEEGWVPAATEAIPSALVYCPNKTVLPDATLLVERCLLGFALDSR